MLRPTRQGGKNTAVQNSEATGLYTRLCTQKQPRWSTDGCGAHGDPTDSGNCIMWGRGRVRLRDDRNWAMSAGEKFY